MFYKEADQRIIKQYNEKMLSYYFDDHGIDSSLCVMNVSAPRETGVETNVYDFVRLTHGDFFSHHGVVVGARADYYMYGR